MSLCASLLLTAPHCSGSLPPEFKHGSQSSPGGCPEQKHGEGDASEEHQATLAAPSALKPMKGQAKEDANRHGNDD
eukprot:CAMPEP_0170573796 /NCGR_PEP_ID=MMETSP0224-20130122/2955_1 /TAXON_ID=285029 /ORGANISM="Togula jolla, Strain CCCM 725" /LENGTH=75 /DNA_ID=CAMNT_0010896405 /DNA_START=613 /DNA_END=840 /DNA_ORIENTATION=-